MSWQLTDGTSQPRRLVDALLEAPAVGAWMLTATVSGPEPVSKSVTCKLGAKDWIGTVIHDRIDGGRRRVKVIGGAGGLAKVVPDRAEQSPQTTVRGVARALCTIGGETLADAPETPLGAWTRLRGTVGTCLADLCRTMGLRWRVTAAGQVRVYADEAPEVSAPGTLLEQSAREAVYGVTSFDVEPPCTIGGVDVELVTGQVNEKGEARLTVAKAAIPEAMQALMQGRAHVRVEQARLVQQRGRLVDVRIDAPSSSGYGPGGAPPATGAWAIPGVPLWPGLPGVELKLRPGAGLLVFFVDGDPRKAIALPAPYGEKADEVTITTEGGARFHMHDDVVELGGDTYALVRYEPLVAWLTAIITGVGTAGGTVTPPTPFPSLDMIKADGPGRVG